MNNRQVQIWISVVAGLALVALLLLAASATASTPPPVASVTETQATRAVGGWSSGWVTVTAGTTQVFTHNLGRNPDDYAVEVWFRDTDGGIGINRANYGGMEVGGQWHGAHWQDLTTNTIRVRRHPADHGADQVRIRVWDPPGTPDFDSTWRVITQGHTIVFSHNLGITNTDLTVSLWFSGATRGIHHFGYGGLAVDISHEMHGAHWHDLTTNTIQVTRHLTDTDVEQVRVIVVRGAEPDYDSLEDPSIGGWQPIAPGTEFTFTHSLNWNPDVLLARGECLSPTVSGPGGIHQWFAGGNHDWFVGWQGVHLQNLTDNTIRVVRRQHDQICPQVRVRIWKRSRQLYLPLVVRN